MGFQTWINLLVINVHCRCGPILMAAERHRRLLLTDETLRLCLTEEEGPWWPGASEDLTGLLEVVLRRPRETRPAMLFEDETFFRMHL